MAQQLQTTVLLDAALTGGYKDAFSSANKLMNDLTRHSAALEKELKQIGKQADELDKIGDASEELRRDMVKLEKQIKATNRAVDKFGDAKNHFRNARIGAAAFKQEISDIVGFAGKAALGIAGIGTAAAVALSPPQELQEFDAALSGIRAISPGIDPSSFDEAKAQILDLSNFYGQQASEIAGQFQQLTRSFGFEGATQSIQAALDFQTATGLGIPDIEEELATARVSLGVDTAGELQSFLGLLQKAYAVGIKIDNLDLGDLETLTARVGTDLDSEAFQREFLTTIAFRQVDSFQFADYAAAFKEEIERATFISPEMDAKAILKAQAALSALEKYGIRAEDGLAGAMRVYQGLSEVERVAFFQELEPVLTAMPAEVIARGSEALPQIEQQVNLALGDTGTLADASGEVLSSWSATWGRIGTIGTNTAGILQSRFAEAFGPSIVAGAERLFDFVAANEDKIKNFFTGIHDGVSPVVSKIWNTVRTAWPDIQQFALEVWDELRAQLQPVAPIAKAVGEGIWSILKPVISFVREHPKLVSTLLVGLAVWKAYKIGATGVQAAYDFLAGGVSLLQGHYHKLTADVLGNQRALGGVGNTAVSTGQKFWEMGRNMLSTKFPRTAGFVGGLSNIGKSALGAIPGITAMGTGFWAALLPVLPVIAAVTAGVIGVGALAYIVYKNWEPLKAFFVDNWETIRDVLSIVFPPIGILIGLAGVIRQNYEPLKAFFATVWETIKLSAGIAWEGIQFVVLSAVKFVRDVWAGITGFFANIWGGVRGVFLNSPLAPIFEWMVAGVKTVVSPLLNFFSDIWGGISEGFGNAVKWITDKFEWLNEKLGKVFGWLKQKNKELKDDLKGIETDVSAPMPATTPVVNQEIVGKQGTQRVADDSVSKSFDKNLIEIKETQPIATAGEIVQQTHKTATVVEMPEVKVETPMVKMPELPSVEMPQQQAIEVTAVAPKVEMPEAKVEMPQQQAIEVTAVAPKVEMPEAKVEMPQQQAIEVTAVAPKVEMPEAKVEMPQQQAIEVTAVAPKVEMPEAKVEMPQQQAIEVTAVAPKVEMPEAKVEMPQQQAIEVTAVAPKVEMPEAKVEMPQQQAIEVTAVAPKVEMPETQQIQAYHNIINQDVLGKPQAPVAEIPETKEAQQIQAYHNIVNQDVLGKPKLLPEDEDRKRKSVPLSQSASESEVNPNFAKVMKQITDAPIKETELRVSGVPVTEGYEDAQLSTEPEIVDPGYASVLSKIIDRPVKETEPETVDPGYASVLKRITDAPLNAPLKETEPETVDPGFERVLKRITDEPLKETELPNPDQTLDAAETSVDSQQINIDVPAQDALSVDVQSDGGTESSVSITNHFVIHQQPGEDGEDLSEKIALILEKQLNTARGRFPTQ